MNMPSGGRGAWVTGVFLLLTLLMTYPLVLHLGTSVRDPGDPLLNAWILSWDVQQIVRGNVSGFFDTNIFFPHKRTLAYSEFLVPQALVALPAILLSGNPVLGHNLALLFAFLTTGLGMYALARRLTGSTPASIAAGFIFAFSPFMMSHLYQVQVVTAAGIPLSFLFLHKFFDGGRVRDILLFSLFFILQALANGYYALYLVVFCGLFILVQTIVRKKWRSGRFWIALALAVVLIAAVIGPFYYQYYRVQREMGFSRDIQAAAKLTSYLATTSINNLYGKLTAPLMESERALFPGVVPFLLGCLGAALSLKLKARPAPAPPPGRTAAGRFDRAAVWTLHLAGWGALAAMLYVLGWGDFTLKLGPLGSVHAHGPIKPFILALVFFTAAVALRRFRGVRLFRSVPDWDTPWMYLLFLILGFLLTLGPYGPLPLLHKYVPGFNGLRVAARFHVFFMFGLAVLAAHGLAGLGRRPAGSRPRTAVLLLLPVLIVIEYLSLPVLYVKAPVKTEIPEVYRWLGRQPGDFALAELPFPSENRIPYTECSRVYFSAYHWKKTVGGYSGFFPPLYLELLRRYRSMPTERLVRDLKDLDVRMIIVHAAEVNKRRVLRALKHLAGPAGELREAARFGTDIVYEIPPRAAGTDPLEESGWIPLPRTSWKASAGVNPGPAARAIDGDMTTRWDTAGPQEAGQWFELDLGRPAVLRGVSLKLGTSLADYPRAVRVEVSSDGTLWSTAVEVDPLIVPIRTFLRPGSAAAEIVLPRVEARFLRLVQTRRHPVWYWSIHEVVVWAER